MTSMWTILITNAIFYIGILLLSVNMLDDDMLLGIIICVSTIIFLIAGFIALKFEVDAGYYECKKCHHKFVPTYKEVMMATHIGTVRHLKCPNCKKKELGKKSVVKIMNYNLSNSTNSGCKNYYKYNIVVLERSY